MNKRQLKIYVNKKKDIFNKKISLINEMSLDKQKEIYLILLKTISPYCRNLSEHILINKENNKVSYIDEPPSVGKNSVMDKVYENIFDKLCELGPPFYKHRKGTKIHKRSIKYIKKYYKKHRSGIIDIFQLGQKYFLDKDFLFKLNDNKISISDFFKYEDKRMQFSPNLSRWTKSWFNEFAKGNSYIETKFMCKPKEINSLLTNEFIDLWEEIKLNKMTETDKRYAIIFIQKLSLMAKNNNMDTKSLMIVTKNIMQENSYINNAKYLCSDYFLNNLLPKEMVKMNLFRSIKEINI